MSNLGKKKRRPRYKLDPSAADHILTVSFQQISCQGSQEESRGGGGAGQEDQEQEMIDDFIGKTYCKSFCIVYLFQETLHIYLIFH